MRRSERDALDNELARKFIKRNNDHGHLGTPSTPGGGSETERASDAFRNPMTTLGDLIKGLASGAPGRLSIGSNGDVLTVVAGIPAWSAAPSGTYSAETAQDDIGAILTDTASINLTYDDAGNAITADVILEWLQDTVAAMLTGGTHTGITTTYQDPGGVVDLAVTGGGGLTQEQIEDFLGVDFTDSASIDVVYDDALATFTWSAIFAGTGAASTVARSDHDHDTDYADIAITQYTDEQAQDATGAMIADTASINLTYTDATPELKADVIDSYINDLIGAYVDDDAEAEFTAPSSWVYTHRMGWVSANPGAATNTAVYLALTTQGTPGADDATDGNWIIYTSATGINNVAGLTSTAHQYYADWNLTLWDRIKTGTVTGCRIWICYQGSVTPTLTDAPNGSFVGFRFTAGTDTNWQCMSGNSSANTQTTDSGIAVTADTVYQMRIVFGTVKVRFYINEVLVAEHTTHRPASGVRLTNHGTVITNTVGGAGTARTLRINRIHIATIR